MGSEAGAASEKRKKVFIFGLDGASYKLTSQWMREGKLPNLSRIRAKGVGGRLISTIPPSSPTSWTSIVTGKNPGKHGIFNFTQRREGGYDMQIANSKLRRTKAIWNILNEAGRKVGIVNLPATYPPDKVDGFMISGIPSPGQTSAYPKSLMEEISDYKEEVDPMLCGYMATRDSFIEELRSIEENRGKTALYLMERYDWDFFLIVFTALDRIQHFFWKYMDPNHPSYNPEEAKEYGDTVLSFYQKIDSIIGEIVAKLDEDTVVVALSDHGFEPQYRIFYLDEWLMSLGLLKLKPRSTYTLTRKLGPGNVERLFYFQSSKNGFLLKSRKLMKFLRDFIAKKALMSILPSFNIKDVDWSKTKAYCGNYFDIYINLKGREPKGIVNPGEEYEKVRDYIISELYKLKDPETGENLVDKVYKREEIYSGPFVDQASDLVFTMKHTDRATPVSNPEALIMPSPIRSGAHEALSVEDGIFLMAGNGVKQGVEVDVRTVDVLPTVLQLMGLPIPDDVDGQVLTNILEGVSEEDVRLQKESAYEHQPEEVWSAEEEKLIRERLKGWGY
ncbi:alkaline phosphatase family protein [Candidatus Hecatella orcuttiae]|jgi:predicted AlkP superfamily phosphohydrolase/phosphomutase|uniref:alkaline phosphatase family protein n=1 Tax=Candidatus Hecatella orcuttiae TaxID=1935119 RepID=UPI0028683569|nr:alkaline phosphatase family protein [Candidatus Hecatella orcuttiae]